MINIDEINDKQKYIEIIKKLNMSRVDLCILMGVISFLIYSKDIFPRNLNVAEFIEDNFKISYPKYVIRSRTLIVAKITRHLYFSDESVIVDVLPKLINYFHIENAAFQKTGRKRNENDKLNTWLEGL
ncbi:MAG: hypothetical protein E6X17_06115 [Sporomusaceae bacterium]|nr:hypothetical protein [Sporomusaceae bacterium]